MQYEHPLPAGLTEPDPRDVEVAALWEIVSELLHAWPDQKLIDRAAYLETRGVGPAPAYVAAQDVVSRRGSERAARVLRDIWDARMEIAELRSAPEDDDQT